MLLSLFCIYLAALWCVLAIFVDNKPQAAGYDGTQTHNQNKRKKKLGGQSFWLLLGVQTVLYSSNVSLNPTNTKKDVYNTLNVENIKINVKPMKVFVSFVCTALLCL